MREAIKTANNNFNFGGCVASLSVFGDDTIILPAGIYTLTIAGAGDDSNATGDLDIMGNLIIVGAGSGVTTIDGNALDRVFDVGTYTSPIATISGVKITNGVGSGGESILWAIFSRLMTL